MIDTIKTSRVNDEVKTAMHYDHIIIGAGSMGAAAGYFLAKQGQRVLLVDALHPPHDAASHHGDTRLIRFAYGEGDYYVPFALRARDLWQQLEQEICQQLFLQTGILNVGRADEEFLQNVQASAQQFDLPIEVLSAQQAMDKWPGLSLPEDFIACFEPTSGVLKTKESIAAYLQLAEQHSATFLPNTKIVQIEATSDEVRVTTANGDIFHAANVIVTVGAWAKELLATTGLTLQMQPTRKTFAWYEADEALYQSALFPGFAFQLGTESYYGFPSIDGAGLKVGRHDLGEAIHPDDDKAPFGEVAGDQEDLDHFLARFMPQVGTLKFGKTCMYAMTPDEDFIIDRHPAHENIIIAAGFSGHGFKFASAVGEALSELATKRTTTIDLQAFSLKRF